VIASDLVKYDGAAENIATPIDFLLEQQRPMGFTQIVTNPPYGLADKFVRHALELGCDVYVLLRLMSIEGASRSDIMDHCVRIWAGIERLPFMHRDGYSGPKNSSSGAPFAWFRFTPEKRLGRTIALQRISWRNP
jgi:hypothetical protein